MIKSNHIYSKQDFHVDVMMSFIFYLLWNQALQPDNNTGIAVSGYIEKLANHPGRDSALMGNVVKQLSSQW